MTRVNSGIKVMLGFFQYVAKTMNPKKKNLLSWWFLFLKQCESQMLEVLISIVAWQNSAHSYSSGLVSTSPYLATETRGEIPFCASRAEWEITDIFWTVKLWKLGDLEARWSTASLSQNVIAGSASQFTPWQDSKLKVIKKNPERLWYVGAVLKYD